MLATHFLPPYSPFHEPEPAKPAGSLSRLGSYPGKYPATFHHKRTFFHSWRTHALLSTYLPNLKNENPAQCLLLYVTQPRFPEPGNDVSEYLTVETPVEIGLRMMGGLDPSDIIGYNGS